MNAWQERLKSEATRIYEKLRESPTVSKLFDRYENMTPTMQKLIVYGGLGVIAFTLIMVPLTSFLSSIDSLQQYEQRRELVHQLFRASDNSEGLANLMQPPLVDTLPMRIEADLKAALLLPEQISSVRVEPIPPGSKGAEGLTGAVKVSLSQLNLKQVVDIGYQLQNMGASLKVLDVDLQASDKDPRYLDAVFRLVAIKVPALPAPEPEPVAGKKGGKASSKDKKGDDL
jgi:hypothetical protein